MFRKSHLLFGGLAVATAALLSTGTALAATSGGYPHPTPSPSVTETTPPPVPTPVLQQQEFDLQIANALPNDWVLGTGPISIVGGIDKPVNSRVDLFESANGANGVRINHEALFGAQIDRATCSIIYDQRDLPWSIHQGFGTFAGATGNGVYDLVGLFSFPTVRNHCTLPRGLTSAQADRDLNGNGGGLPAPLAVGIDVQAVGRAAVVPPVVKPPKPCPTKSYWATPSADDTAFVGGVSDCPTTAPAV